jgi:hypothetical protein
VILADFAVPGGEEAWRLFTDQVMGGVSEARATVEEVAGRRALRLRGTVRLENRGGFVQVALTLGGRGGALDASRFRALRLAVCGRAPGAYLHLRTRDTGAPWAHYAAPFALADRWQEVEVPFATFAGSAVGAPLDRGALTRLGIVAGKAAGPVDLAVARVELV